MEEKKYTEVYIAGKVYTLGGFEEEEYLQKIAAYVNSKVTELRGQQGYLKLSADYQNVLLQLNLADDVFKIRRQVTAAEKKLSAQEQETYHVKHDMVGMQKKLDAATAELETARQALSQRDEELSQAREDLDQIRGDYEELRQQLEEAREQIAVMQKRLPQGDNKPKLLK